MRTSAYLAGPLLLLLATSSAAAEEEVNYAKRLAILPIVVEGPHGSASLSAIFGAISAATAQRVELRVVSYEEMFVASQDGLVERVRDCGPDDKCIAGRLRRFNARYGVVVVLNFGLSPPLMSIQVLDTDLGKKIADHLGELDSTVESEIVAALEKEADLLLEAAGFARSGRLVVQVDPPNATVSLASGAAPDLGSGAVFTVPAGSYEVRGSAPGWDDASTNAEVRSGETTSVSLSLSLQTSIWESPWLWIATGVVVVGGVVTAAAVSRQPDSCLCFQIDGRGCTACFNR